MIVEMIARDGKAAADAQPETTRVSVVIPVFNDGERLGKCLDRLSAQTYPQSHYEVIVVDNGSTQPLEPTVEHLPCVRVVREPRPGSYAARNRGIASATGEIIAFTDSDCLPAPDWIEKGVTRLLRESTCGLVAGRVEVFVQDPAAPTAVEIHEQVTAFPQQRYVEIDHYGATANVFTFRSVIDAVGPFNDRLKSSGDNEWGRRVFAAGYRQVYADEVRVCHPARRSMKDVYRKVARLAGGQRDLNGRTRYSWLDLFRDVRPPLGLIWRTLHDRRLPGASIKLQFIAVEVFMRYARAWERTRLYMGGASIR